MSFLDGHAEPMTLEDLGYQLNEDGTPTPILDPMAESYTASNKLWNGEGCDHIAVQARRRQETGRPAVIRSVAAG